MGHYYSEMGDRPIPASWTARTAPEGESIYGPHSWRKYPYSFVRDFVKHDPCGQLFDFDRYSEEDTDRAVQHHQSCAMVKHD